MAAERPQLFAERNGKRFSLYPGLLCMAHERGLIGISTDLVQVPNAANGDTAICRATASFKVEADIHIYTGIGDAAPNNVSAAMRTCIIRMSETRAKARALRDALNIGAAALEELAEDDEHCSPAPVPGSEGPKSAAAAAQRRRRQAVPARSSTDPYGSSSDPYGSSTDPYGPATPTSGPTAPITEPQREAIRSLCGRRGADPDAIASARFGTPKLVSLTQAQASELIKSLNDQGRSTRPQAAGRAH